MTDRRTFLKTGITALALPMVARNAFSLPLAVPAAKQSYVVPYKVIYDERYHDSVAFAGEAKKLGAAVHGIKGDVTDLWYNDLYHEWRKGPAAIMGMTTADALFCLQLMAQDQRMHVVFRVEHNYLPDNKIEHLITGPSQVPHELADLANVGPAWNIRMSNAVMQYPDQRVKPVETKIVTQLDRTVTDQQPLVTWVIAPIRKARV